MWLPERNTLLLMLCLLLALWLLLRVNEQKEEKRKPTRRNPLNHEELGRMIFDAITSHDIHNFRGLFLMGREVAEVRAADTDAYLATMRGPALADFLDRLRQQVPTRAHYRGLEFSVTEVAMLHIEVDGKNYHIPIGTVVKSGTFWRLNDGAFALEQSP